MSDTKKTADTFGIMEMQTGLLDGWYPSKEHAQVVVEAAFRKRHPWGKWVIVSLVDYAEPDDVFISDHRFPAIALDEIPHGLTDIRQVVDILGRKEAVR